MSIKINWTCECRIVIPYIVIIYKNVELVVKNLSSKFYKLS